RSQGRRTGARAPDPAGRRIPGQPHAAAEEVTRMNYDAEARRTPLPSGRDAGTPAIVVGIDGSDTGWDAFAWAAGEARRTNGHLVAVYVMPYTEPAAALGVPYDFAVAQDNQRAL